MRMPMLALLAAVLVLAPTLAQASWNLNLDPDEVTQYASRVVGFSSQFNTDTWSAAQVIGQPNVYAKYGDYHGTWAQARGQFDKGWIAVEFDRAVYPDLIHVFETYHAGAVVEVQALHPNGDWRNLWRKRPLRPDDIHSARKFAINVQDTSFATKQLKLILDLTAAKSYCEIDAIELIGRRTSNSEEYYWADKVTGYSSQYSAGSWSADKILGEFDVYPNYGDLRNSWAQKRGHFSDGWIQVSIKTPLDVKSIVIYETFHAGAVTKVSLKRPSGGWFEVYSGGASDIRSARAFKPTLKETAFLTSEVRLDMDLSKARTYCEIDAIKVAGTKTLTTACQWKEYIDQFVGGGALQRGYMELDDCKKKCLAVSCKGLDFGKRQCWLHTVKDKEPIRSIKIAHYKPLNCY